MKAFNKYLVLVFFISASTLTFGQSGAFQGAQRAFSKFNFQRAADILKKVVDKDPSNVAAKEKLADSYRLLNRTEDAEYWYGQLAQAPNPKPIHLYYYAQYLKSNGKYDDARTYYDAYFKLIPGDFSGADNAMNSALYSSLSQDNPAYNVSLLNINSKGFDFSPVYYRDGIVFVSNRGAAGVVKRTDEWTQGRFLDLFYAKKNDDGTLSNVVKLKGEQPNRKYHEGSCTFSQDFNEIYFTRNAYVKCKTQKSADKTVKLKIFHAEYNSLKKSWVNLSELPFDNKEYSVAHPSLSKDGNSLFFISEMPGGEGETDLYVSYKQGNTWGAPVNLGKGVNTPGREMFPFIGDDGCLYFASDGRMGLGGLDIYKASLANNVWGNVVNLGAPVNSNKDDFGYIMAADGKSGYMNSNRAGTNGEDDLYYFTREPEQCLEGVVLDAKTNQKIQGVKVEVLNLETKTSGVAGEFTFCPIRPNTRYTIIASKEGYRKNSIEVTSPPKGNLNVKIPIRKNENIDMTVNVTEEGKPKSDVSIVLTDLSTGRQFPCKTGVEGSCIYGLQPNKQYELIISANSSDPKCSYGRIVRKVSTVGKTAPSNIYENINLKLICQGVIIEIPDIYYDLGKYNVRPDAAIQLDKVVQMMKDYPNMTIELRSHTDCRAGDAFNMKLSQNRAKAALNYIVSKGISAGRMTAKGYGESMLKIVCDPCKTGCSEAQHQMNRRTEMKILK